MTASYTEAVLSFSCHGEPLLGIVSAPPQPATLAVVIVVGGPQYRAGSHRQFVSLARSLASAGFAALRFDYRGMGDAGGDLRNFEQVSDDIGAAIGALLQAQPAVQRVVLWGLCDGASAALLYLHERPDPRVAGLALLNPWVRSEASLAKTHVKHYYVQRLKEPEFWQKLLSGKVAWGALSGFGRNLAKALGGGDAVASAEHQGPFQDRMAAAWAGFDGPLLLMLSELDLTAREFSEFAAASATWQQALARSPGAREVLMGADHTCSTASTQGAMEAVTRRWLQQLLVTSSA